MQGLVYILCTITSVASAFFLARASRGASGRLMFWSAICFAGMAVNNLLLYIDVAVGPKYDWSLAPNIVALISVAVLIYALVWEAV